MAQKDPCSNDEVVKGVERWDEVATVGGEGGEREEGSGRVVEGIDDTIAAQQVVVTLTVTDPSPVGAEGGERGEDESTKLVDLSLPPVNWDLVSSLDQYYQTTIKERMPAIFRDGSADNSVSTHLIESQAPPNQVGVGGALHK